MKISLFISCLLALRAPAAAQQMDRSKHMMGMYGPYAMTREATGTSWQPDSTPHEGLHLMAGDWAVMVHGFADGVYDRQGGPRGDDKAFSESMLMAVARRPLGPGTLGLRSMVSLDPAMGSFGYPLLLQTGETGDGRAPLVDRQHPHDLFMELAATYSLPVGDDGSVFAYFGLPGEPALGPAAFMHRFSGMDDPSAPISHHWLDSTHITEGVATLGATRGDWKLEGSAFRGREPDQRRWDVEGPGFDSWSARLSWNPARDWALQASYGHLRSPEALQADVNTGRLTASASWNVRAGPAFAQTTFAWGRNLDTAGAAEGAPARDLDAFLLESAVRAGPHTVFARAERVDKEDLFDSGPLAGRVPGVEAFSLGYVYDFARRGRAKWGLGGVGTLDVLPASARAAYGGTPASFLLFARVKLM